MGTALIYVFGVTKTTKTATMCLLEWLNVSRLFFEKIFCKSQKSLGFRKKVTYTDSNVKSQSVPYLRKKNETSLFQKFIRAGQSMGQSAIAGGNHCRGNLLWHRFVGSHRSYRMAQLCFG